MKIAAQHSRSNNEHTLSITSVPAHPGGSQALLELFHTALNCAGANRETLFTKLKILHSSLMTLKVSGKVIPSHPQA